jgi:hypothetical protein
LSKGGSHVDVPEGWVCRRALVTLEKRKWISMQMYAGKLLHLVVLLLLLSEGTD